MENSLQKLNTTQAVQEWSLRIKECRSSGLTVKEWCKQRDIRPQTFYFWQKKIFTMVAESCSERFVEIPNAAICTSSTNIIAKIVVSGISIEILNTATTEQITQLIQAAKQC